jgi:hypothetical protein
MLFAQGAAKFKTVGVHHYGLACDIVKDIGGEPSWKGDFKFLGRLAKKHKLIWGAAWGSPASNRDSMTACMSNAAPSRGRNRCSRSYGTRTTTTILEGLGGGDGRRIVPRNA